ncbi:MAG TPA: FecR domain-containing protein, partial [Terriglobales bacterium]|nr:FecR domain-containing protein [Terriglobales bacterium]
MNPQDLDDHDRKIDQLLAERSSRLLERMKQGDPSAPENLVEFLFESKRNLRQYMRAVAVDRALERVDRERKWKLAPPSSEDSNVIVLAANAENDSPPPPTRAKRLLWSLAAVLVGSFLLVAWGLSHWLLGERAAEHVFATTVGEQRAIELPDGSVIHLNTQSRLKVYFTEQTRNIQLLAGEAL